MNKIKNAIRRCAQFSSSATCAARTRHQLRGVLGAQSPEGGERVQVGLYLDFN